MIEIQYDGKRPNLCRGRLVVIVDDKRYIFPEGCLSSGGSCGFTNNYENFYINHGMWDIEKFPEDFPENLKGSVIMKVNEEIPHGCCGGCL